MVTPKSKIVAKCNKMSADWSPEDMYHSLSVCFLSPDSQVFFLKELPCVD